MNREILFKGFCPSENGTQIITLSGEDIRGEWVEGFYAQTDIGTFIVQYNVDCELEATLMTDYEVDPETVCQYTGLKDARGYRIWEGDKFYTYFSGDVIIEYNADFTAFQAVYDNDEWDYLADADLPYRISDRFNTRSVKIK